MRLRPKGRRQRNHGQRYKGNSAARGYGHKWRKARAVYLKQNPLCAVCLALAGRPVPAEVVDHIVPHKGDRDLFWSRDNWQPLCKPCHDRKSGEESLGWQHDDG